MATGHSLWGAGVYTGVWVRLPSCLEYGGLWEKHESKVNMIEQWLDDDSEDEVITILDIDKWE